MEAASRKFRRGLILAAAFLLCGCPRTISSDEIDAAEIAQHYRMEFDADAERTRVTAVFYLRPPSSGAFFFPLPITDYVELVSPSFVSHDGIALAKREDGSDWPDSGIVHYAGAEDGLIPHHVWYWMDPDGTAHSNELTIRRADFVGPPASISIAAPGVIEFTPPLEMFETVAFVIDPDGETPLNAGGAYELGASSLVIDAADLALLARGTQFARLLRTTEVALQEHPGAGGALRGASRSRTIEFELTD